MFFVDFWNVFIDFLMANCFFCFIVYDIYSCNDYCFFVGYNLLGFLLYCLWFVLIDCYFLLVTICFFCRIVRVRFCWWGRFTFFWNAGDFFTFWGWMWSLWFVRFYFGGSISRWSRRSGIIWRWRGLSLFDFVFL